MKVAQQAETDITTTTTFLACKRVGFQAGSTEEALLKQNEQESEDCVLRFTRPSLQGRCTLTRRYQSRKGPGSL